MESSMIEIPEKNMFWTTGDVTTVEPIDYDINKYLKNLCDQYRISINSNRDIAQDVALYPEYKQIMVYPDEHMEVSNWKKCLANYLTNEEMKLSIFLNEVVIHETKEIKIYILPLVRSA